MTGTQRQTLNADDFAQMLCPYAVACLWKTGEYENVVRRARAAAIVSNRASENKSLLLEIAAAPRLRQ